MVGGFPTVKKSLRNRTLYSLKNPYDLGWNIDKPYK